jgi:hypothetical protein
MSPEEISTYALGRIAVFVRVTPSDRPGYVGMMLPLWHEAEKAPGEPHERADVWRVIWIVGDDTTGLSFRSGTVNALDAEPAPEANPNGDAPPAFALSILSRPTMQNSFDRMEIVLLAARLGLQVSFGYTKDDAQPIEEERRGVPLGYRPGKDGDLLVLADADRGGEKRSFKASRITALRLVPHQRLPIWSDDTGWTLPAA